jgi:protein-L-isoaspartate(D-aspartate) O-methyltransferase
VIDHGAARAEMVQSQLISRGVREASVLEAMRSVPRHRFIPEDNQDLAYRDGPVAIGQGQTISQPYIVAVMSEALRLTPGMRVLEIGTGSGYQAAVLCALGAQVFSMEIREGLAVRARSVLDSVGAQDVQTHTGNGFDGLEAAMPFDRIIVTAAPSMIPPPLVEQLRVGAMMLIPVGERRRQTLFRVERTPQGTRQESLLPVLFVPMTGGPA